MNPLKLAMAMRKHENMPRECPIPGCSATPWVLNIKTHLARCHPTVATNTVALTEWVVVSQDDEKKKGASQKNTHADEAQDHVESGKGGRQRGCVLLLSLSWPLRLETGARCKLRGIWVFRRS